MNAEMEILVCDADDAVGVLCDLIRHQFESLDKYHNGYAQIGEGEAGRLLYAAAQAFSMTTRARKAWYLANESARADRAHSVEAVQ